jgi:hypothetical protein
MENIGRIDAPHGATIVGVALILGVIGTEKVHASR